jgi:hypothetical protein
MQQSQDALNITHHIKCKEKELDDLLEKEEM